MLKFFGRDSAFGHSNNSAFFIDGKDLVLIDCPMSSFQKVKFFDFKKFDNIYVLVTHTHGDHISGIGTFVYFLYFLKNKKLTVVAPNRKVYYTLNILLKDIEGCDDNKFNIITGDSLDKKWFVKSILTKHVDSLDCFGYLLNIKDTPVIYTGDTATLEPFKDIITDNSYLFTEIAYNNSGVHLYYKEVLPTLIQLSEKGVKVFLMHLDDIKNIKDVIKDTSLELAPLVFPS